ncbi:MAG TPA: hypothetical protein VGC64_01080, partial [Pyrinomonadaceae bacterium]
DGVHTYDIYKEGVSSKKVGTREFAEAVVERLGQQPQRLKAVHYQPGGSEAVNAQTSTREPEKKETIGVDVFLDWTRGTADELGAAIEPLAGDLRLTMISNRGVKVWPEGSPETFLTDHWRCRFMAQKDGGPVTHAQITAVLARISEAGFDFIQTQNLCNFNGHAGYQG